MAPELSKSPTTSPDDYVRLHITPFNPALLNAVIAPSIQPSARNISFHTLQTFPDQGYGYVELPKMEAEKIKKKLKGAILKGSKVRIDVARPEKQLAGVGETEDRPKKRSKEERDSKKRKRDSETIPAVELRDRKVKRGWTEPTTAKFERRSKDKDTKQTVIKSKYTSQPECLFKATLPANVASKLKASDAKVESNIERKKKKHNGKEIVVHEFAKTTKYASFLRGSGPAKDSKTAVEFVEGKGWIDENGNVVENAPVQKPKKTVVVKKKVEVEESETSSSGSSSSEEEDSSSSEDDEDEEEDIEMEDEPAVSEVASAPYVATEIAKESEPSSDSSSEEEGVEEDSDSESDSDAESSPDSKVTSIEPQSTTPAISTEKSIQITKKASPDPEASTTPEDSSSEAESEDSEPESDSSSSSEEEFDSSSEADSREASEDVAEDPAETTNRPTSSNKNPLSLTIPTASEETKPGEVHPLEALYKRRKISGEAPALNEDTAAGFSFFGGDNNDDIEEDEEMNDVAPMTPYTRREFESRGYRSAAPTPDTAHPNKSFNWSVNDNEEEDEEDQDQGYGATPVQKKHRKFTEPKEEGKAAAEPIGDFQKWFYEHRGETNRAWKKRRKVAAKESRQRENRKRGDRA